MDMPLYQSVKKVRALEIADVDYDHPQLEPLITFKDSRYAPRFVKPELFLRYRAVPGDFFVVYDDGYQSISPAKAFNEGYVALPE